MPGVSLRLALIASICIGAGCNGGHRDVVDSVDAARQSPMRIVTLAPHLAELVHDAGAGEMLVGVSAYSDFPEEIRTLPQIGDAFLVDQERLALLEPDIVLAWESGTPARSVELLRERGFRVETLRTQRLADVARALQKIGRLTGQPQLANAAADVYLRDLDRLRQAHRGRERIRVFYQISSRPIYTVSGSHYVSELIDLCGGINVFADLGELAPLVSEEAVLARDPEVLIAGGAAGDPANDDTFAEWLRWGDLAAVRYDNLFTLDANLLGRATTRLVSTAEALCAALDTGRQRRSDGRG